MTLRRPPPPFRRVKILRTENLTPRLCRVTLSGPELEGLVVDQPAASVRVLLPAEGQNEPVIPEWAGNEFLLEGGVRPTIRTLTPRRVDPANLELDVDVVIHDGGAASGWASRVQTGDGAAVSGPARGYEIDPDRPGFVLAGDETALPAISQLLEQIPDGKPVTAYLEVSAPAARLELPDRPGATVMWLDLPVGATPGDAMVAGVQGAEIPAGSAMWVAGEAAAVQRIRRHVFETLGLPRSDATVRGYWKHGRTASQAD